jgi:hypothetical protein
VKPPLPLACCCCRRGGRPLAMVSK